MIYCVFSDAKLIRSLMAGVSCENDNSSDSTIILVLYTLNSRSGYRGNHNCRGSGDRNVSALRVKTPYDFISVRGHFDGPATPSKSLRNRHDDVTELCRFVYLTTLLRTTTVAVIAV